MAKYGEMFYFDILLTKREKQNSQNPFYRVEVERGLLPALACLLLHSSVTCCRFHPISLVFMLPEAGTVSLHYEILNVLLSI